MAKRKFDPAKAKRRILKQAREAFRRKFGRDPLPHEPVFFDESKDVPTPISEEDLAASILELLSDLPPQFTYAYKKTGLLLLLEEQAEHYPPDALAEWTGAIDEYFRLESEGKPAALESKAGSTDQLDIPPEIITQNTVDQGRDAMEHPGFQGTIVGTISIELFGGKFETEIRADYVHTPDDEYYDLHSHSLRQGWLATTVSLHAKHPPEDGDDSEKDWVKLGDLTEVIPEIVWDKIFDAVEDQCKLEDAQRRLRFLTPRGSA